MGKLDGKVAIVTGAASGMGKATALKMAEYGAIVNLLDFSEKVSDAAKELKEKGYEADSYRVDVSDLAAVEEVFEKVYDAWRKIDIVVNAAGINRSSRLIDNDAESKRDAEFAVNFHGPWNTCKAALPYMMTARYGKIVNFSSVTGNLVADSGLLSYGASKAAVMGLTRGLALETAEYGITVNAVLPGTIKTPMVENELEERYGELKNDILEVMEELFPMKRLGRPEEAAEVVCFLASDESSYVSGVGIPVDGANTIPEMNQPPKCNYAD